MLEEMRVSWDYVYAYAYKNTKSLNARGYNAYRT